MGAASGSPCARAPAGRSHVAAECAPGRAGPGRRRCASRSSRGCPRGRYGGAWSSRLPPHRVVTKPLPTRRDLPRRVTFPRFDVDRRDAAAERHPVVLALQLAEAARSALDAAPRLLAPVRHDPRSRRLLRHDPLDGGAEGGVAGGEGGLRGGSLRSAPRHLDAQTRAAVVADFGGLVPIVADFVAAWATRRAVRHRLMFGAAGDEADRRRENVRAQPRVVAHAQVVAVLLAAMDLDDVVLAAGAPLLRAPHPVADLSNAPAGVADDVQHRPSIRVALRLEALRDGVGWEAAGENLEAERMRHQPDPALLPAGGDQGVRRQGAPDGCHDAL